MIATVSGRVAAVRLAAAVVEVGGVGMLVHATPATLAGLRVGETARLATSLVVREDSLTLFGFADDDERDVFEQVQTVSGIGPRLALAMLAVHSPDALRSAVATEDLDALQRVPGSGARGPSGWSSSSPTAWAARWDPRWPRHRRRPTAAARWSRRSSGSAGRRRSPSRPSTRWHRAGPGTDVAGVLRAALRGLGGGRA